MRKTSSYMQGMQHTDYPMLFPRLALKFIHPSLHVHFLLPRRMEFFTFLRQLPEFH